MEKQPIIAVIGLATHGKSTVCSILTDFCPKLKFTTIPFAKGVKDAAQRLGWNGKKDAKGRTILQHLGTEVCRNIDPDYWTKRWEENMNDAIAHGAEVILCDDLRFPNELEFLKSKGAYIIKVKKKLSLWQRFKRKVALFFGRVHASEICFKDKEDFCDLVIENYWGFDALEKALEKVVLDCNLRDLDALDLYISETEAKDS